MASIAPTPQQSFAHMAPPQPSPQSQPAGQPHGLPSYAHGYSMSFGDSSSQPSFSTAQPTAYPMPNYSRSFGEGYGPSRGHEGKPQIYTAVYSGVSVYEMEIHGVACMRRRSDGWLNATQILKVAGVDKGKRTKVLEKEILTGEHEKVQGGYGKYQGTWISYKRGREFCRQYGVEDILKPLLDYDVSSDGSGGSAQQDTPTKEQAMAANRKRFYGSSQEGTRPNGPVTNGTFFSSISPTTSVALAAMNKAARLNSPAPRPGSLRHPSQHDAFPGGSQQSFMSESSTGDKHDSGYGTQPNGEPPRKRLRPDSQDGGMAPPGLPLDASMRSATPTEPNESFLYDGTMPHDLLNGNGDPATLAPLPNPASDEQQDKMAMILDLFAEAGRTDYSNHPALAQLSGEDLNIPLDASANNALHWAATLAKVSLLKLLIQKGANIYRGNAAGQSPLISAVLVNNCWEHSCFPELLELLGQLVEFRDIQGRTILHHIAVSSGIRGRAPSSKYYLEALLEWLVRIGNSSNISGTASTTAQTVAAAAANLQANGETAASSQDSVMLASTAPMLQSSNGPVTLVRFLSHVVNARDKAGNTALNLVARVGNRSIIQQLIEIHADPSLPNNKGVSAKDFWGAVDESFADGGPLSQLSDALHTQVPLSQDATVDGEAATDGAKEGSQVEDIGQDVITSVTAMLTQSLASHKDTLRIRSEQIDNLNTQIQEFSALQRQDLDALHEIKERVKTRGERQAKIANLKRSIAEKRRRMGNNRRASPVGEVSPPWLSNASNEEVLSFSPPNGSPNALQRQFITTNLPPSSTLQNLIGTYMQQNNDLQRHAGELKSRSTELEGMYRKVVSLCTGVEEDKVEESLGSLVAAVESERGGLGEQEVGRVREFLRRVDGAVSQAGAGVNAGGGAGDGHRMVGIES